MVYEINAYLVVFLSKTTGVTLLLITQLLGSTLDDPVIDKWNYICQETYTLGNLDTLLQLIFK